MKQASIKKNFIMNAILQLSSVVFPLITYPYVFRVLQPAGTGSVSFAVSLISYFNMAAQLGIPIYGIRCCARVRDDREALSKIAQELLLINLIMSAVAYAALFISLATVPRLMDDRLLYIVVSSNILLTAIGMEWLYRALEKYTYITLRSIAFKLLAMVALFLLVKSPKDYVIYGAITVFASSASFILNLLHVHKYIDLRRKGSYDFRKHMRAILVFFAMSCATQVYLNMDVLMLGFMKTKTDVGYYDVAVKIKVVLVNVVTALGAVLLPRASYYIEHGEEEAFRRISKKAVHFILLFATPLSLYFVLFSRPSVLLLAGSSYEGAIPAMMWIMPTLLFIGLTNILGIQVLIPLGKETEVLRSEIIGAAVDLALNLVLIPRYGAAGAAIGTLAAEAAVLLYQCWALRDRIRDLFGRLPVWKMGISCIAAALAAFWVRFTGLGNAATLVCSALCFFVTYFVVLTLSREPFVLEYERQLIHRIRGRRHT